MVKEFTAIIEIDEDGVYIGRIAQLKGCVTYGYTLDELMDNLKDALQLYLEVEGEDPEANKFLETRQILVS